MDVVSEPAIVQLSSEVRYESPFVTMREDRIRRLDGSEGIYSWLEKPDFALVIPEENDGFWLVEQYRYPLKARSLEFPQGTYPDGESGSMDQLAALELKQETGIEAATWDTLGVLHAEKGMTGQRCFAYLATDLRHGEPELEDSEQDLERHWVARTDFEERLRRGAITDAATVAAYTLLLLLRRS